MGGLRARVEPSHACGAPGRGPTFGFATDVTRSSAPGFGRRRRGRDEPDVGGDSRPDGLRPAPVHEPVRHPPAAVQLLATETEARCRSPLPATNSRTIAYRRLP